MGVRCFFLEPTKKLRRQLRRYRSCEGIAPCPLMPGQYSRHDASVPFDEVEKPNADGIIEVQKDKPDNSDPRWPTHCGCGYAFEDSDERQVFADRLYVRSDTRDVVAIRDAGPGAIYNADWYADHPCWCGPDGRSLIAILPNGNEWHIDGPANNCTDKEGFMAAKHKCWIRHGEPPMLTVDKNGPTCHAGAGSILSGNYHGFLRNGEFTNG